MEWISVKSAEKPNDREIVLAYVEMTNVFFIVQYIADRDCFLHNSGFYLTMPTHWTRIEPPKDSEVDKGE